MPRITTEATNQREKIAYDLFLTGKSVKEVNEHLAGQLVDGKSLGKMNFARVYAIKHAAMVCTGVPARLSKGKKKTEEKPALTKKAAKGISVSDLLNA